MKAYTRGPWTQGRTLLTGQTSQWTEEQWNQNEAIENRMVFANFSNADKGISRVRVATCETKYDAMLIAATPDLFEALEDLLENYKENKGEGLGIGPIMKAKQALAKARGESVDK